MPAKTLEKTMDIDDILLKKARRKDLLWQYSLSWD